jgi:hypothetical protein
MDRKRNHNLKINDLEGKLTNNKIRWYRQVLQKNPLPQSCEYKSKRKMLMREIKIKMGTIRLERCCTDRWKNMERNSGGSTVERQRQMK